MSDEQTELGQSKYFPAPEKFLLQEEEVLGDIADFRFARVLILFQFLLHGKAIPIDYERMSKQDFDGLQVVGLAGTMTGLAGLYAQCCWFEGENLDRMWVVSDTINALELRQDVRFRGGRTCMWLSTGRGDYALGIPHGDYMDMWEQTLHGMGQAGIDARVHVWPQYGLRPAWWGSPWIEAWPGPERSSASSAAEKRRASREVHRDGSGKRSRPGGGTGGSGHQVGPLDRPARANLVNRAPWVLTPDQGDIVPDPERASRSSHTSR